MYIMSDAVNPESELDCKPGFDGARFEEVSEVKSFTDDAHFKNDESKVGAIQICDEENKCGKRRRKKKTTPKPQYNVAELKETLNSGTCSKSKEKKLKSRIRKSPEETKKRMAEAEISGIKVAIDLRYAECESKVIASKTAQALFTLYKSNLRFDVPFHLIVVNYLTCGLPIQKALEYFDYKNWMVETASGDFNKCFNIDDLVYITPHADVPIYEFSTSKIYILGASVNNNSENTEVLDVARRLGIRTARLPLIDLSLPLERRNVHLPFQLSGLLILRFLRCNSWLSAMCHSTIKGKYKIKCEKIGKERMMKLKSQGFLE